MLYKNKQSDEEKARRKTLSKEEKEKLPKEKGHIMGFKAVPVFDSSQLDKPFDVLPEIEESKKDLSGLLAQLLRDPSVTLATEPDQINALKGAKGDRKSVV